MSEIKREYTERLHLQGHLVRELERGDLVGKLERNAAARGLMLALSTIEALCHDNSDNHRYLRAWMDDELDDFEAQMEAAAPDANTISVLLEILNQDSKALLIQRLWDDAGKSAWRYAPVLKTWDDDRNRRGLEGYMLEARCGKCRQTFVPDHQSFVGLNAEDEGLYEHYLSIQEIEDGRVTEQPCGGLGIITGGYKGTDSKQVGGE
jgi:hypothetical protein